MWPPELSEPLVYSACRLNPNGILERGVDVNRQLELGGGLLRSECRDPECRNEWTWLFVSASDVEAGWNNNDVTMVYNPRILSLELFSSTSHQPCSSSGAQISTGTSCSCLDLEPPPLLLQSCSQDKNMDYKLCGVKCGNCNVYVLNSRSTSTISRQNIFPSAASA